MTEPADHGCPECGAPRGADNTPSCTCTQRAARALREARTAQTAAAEDFDRLRIRPYVQVPEPSGPEPSPSGLRLPEGGRGVRGVRGDGPGLAATTATTATPGTKATAATAATAIGVAPEAAEESRPRRRTRRTALLSVAGAGATVVAVTVAGLASGLFGYQAPSRDRAAPEVRESVPDVTASDAVPPSPPSSPSSTVARQPTRSASRSAARGRSGAPTPSAPTPTVTPSTPGTSSETASGSPDTVPAAPLVLRRGDKGPEITELQLRLRQLNLYGDQANGVFTRPVEDAVRRYQLARGIQGDDPGTYGPATRASLESETSQP
ncbi:peptidoglycan-binding protein [Streptomyces sp. NK08204]|uniref:peptidoglycan-binding domain-containing protein n=1 Tax=Streptomyces sp. NK08204 TaxID=2873260 RepID=UPI001CECA8EA|nr:peptidoglycan-binding protein [Streptomyces sp. NK08204]